MEFILTDANESFFEKISVTDLKELKALSDQYEGRALIINFHDWMGDSDDCATITIYNDYIE